MKHILYCLHSMSQDTQLRCAFAEPNAVTVVCGRPGFDACAEICYNVRASVCGFIADASWQTVEIEMATSPGREDAM